jgi:hypothetical protein
VSTLVEPKRHALLIATSKYHDPRFDALGAPSGDVNELARLLRKPAVGGFATTVRKDKPAPKLMQDIETFFADRSTDDTLLLYFTGHGITSTDNRFFVVARDTVQDRLLSTGVSGRFLHDVMSRSRSRRQILILDCCFSGAFTREFVAKADRRLHVEGELGGSGRVILTASDALQNAFEGSNVTELARSTAGSLFTRALIDGLTSPDADQDGDGVISIVELHSFIKRRLKELTQDQTPILSIIDSRDGDIEIARAPTVARRSVGPVPQERKPNSGAAADEPVDEVALVRPPRPEELAERFLGSLWQKEVGPEVATVPKQLMAGERVVAVASATPVEAGSSSLFAAIGTALEGLSQRSLGLLALTGQRLIFLRYATGPTMLLKIPYERIVDLRAVEKAVTVTYSDVKQHARRETATFLIASPSPARVTRTIETRRKTSRAAGELGRGTRPMGAFDSAAYTRLVAERLPPRIVHGSDHLAQPLERELGLFPSLLRLDEVPVDLGDAVLDARPLAGEKVPLIRRWLGHRALLALTDRRLVFFEAENRLADNAEFVVMVPYAVLSNPSAVVAVDGIMRITLKDTNDDRVIVPQTTTGPDGGVQDLSELKFRLVGEHATEDAKRFATTVQDYARAAKD